MSRKYPTIWRMRDLLKQLKSGPQMAIRTAYGTDWVPRRGEALPSLRVRLRAAWLVLRGRADALVWDGDQ